MSTSQNINNPFSKLAVGRDREDIMATKIEKESLKKEELLPVLKPVKKIRPQERIKAEKNDDGFIEIKKPPRGSDIDEQLKEVYPMNEIRKDPGYGGEKHRQFRPKGTKRVFNRHSGTGRGREIAKDGAGSKTTWGNPKLFPKDDTENILESALDDIYYKVDENCKNIFLI
jgi:hypothetical protein